MSAELVRNLWTEARPARLAVATTVVLLLLGLAVSLDYGFAMPVLFWLTGGALCFWGARRAAESVTAEIALGTWDQQRMAAQGATGLVLGKLFGATALCWWTAAFGMAGLVLLYGRAVLPLVGFLVAGGVAAQSAALALALVFNQGSQGRVRGSVTGAQLLGIGVGLAIIAPSFGLQLLSMWVTFDVSWWGLPLTHSELRLLLVASIVPWTILASVRLVRAELGHIDPPVAWIAFLAFVVLFVSGFSGDLVASARFAIVLGILYAGVLLAPKGWIPIHDGLRAWRAGQLRRATALTPLWAWTGLLLLAVAYSAHLEARSTMTYAVPATVAFAVRDVAVIQLFTLMRQGTKLWAAVLALVVVHLLGTTLAKFGLPAYIVHPTARTTLELLPAILQTGAAVVALVVVYRRLAGPPEPEPGTAVRA